MTELISRAINSFLVSPTACTEVAAVAQAVEVKHAPHLQPEDPRKPLHRYALAYCVVIICCAVRKALYGLLPHLPRAVSCLCGLYYYHVQRFFTRAIPPCRRPVWLQLRPHHSPELW